MQLFACPVDIGRAACLGAFALAGLLALTVPPAAAQSACTCRAAGISWALDACTCLKTPNGPQRACCGKVLNNTAWKFTGEACPAAQGPVPATPTGNAYAAAPLPQSPLPRSPRPGAAPTLPGQLGGLRISATSLTGISHDQP